MLVLSPTDFLKAKALPVGARSKDGKRRKMPGGKWRNIPKKELEGLAPKKTPIKNIKKGPSKKKPISRAPATVKQLKDAKLRDQKKANIVMPAKATKGLWLAKIKWNTTACSRCGGSGNYSYNAAYGTTCFKCSGSGTQFTKAAKASKKKFDAIKSELRDVPSTSVKIGDKVKFPGKKGWMTVDEITDGGSYTINGVEQKTLNLTQKRTMPDGKVDILTMSAKVDGKVMQLKPWTLEAVAKVNALPGTDTVEWKAAE